jgi:hypothetical protein
VNAPALRALSSLHRTTPRFGNFVTAKPSSMSCPAFGKLRKPTAANDGSLSERGEPPVAVEGRALTPQAPGHYVSHPSARTPGKAQSALPSSQSGAAAAEYGSRHRLLRASAGPTANPWSSGRLQRRAGSARRISRSSKPAGLPAARPNPSLKLTRYGRLCKPGPRQSYYRRVPGLQSLPPRAA